MRKKKKEKMLKTIIPLCISFILIGSLFFGYKLLFNKEKAFLETIETSQYAQINQDAIYGIHLNFKGTFIPPENIEDIKLVLANGKNEISLPLETIHEDDKIEFSTSNLINTGINLETLPEGTYYLLLKTTATNDKKDPITKYYSVENKTNYQDFEYYTLTKNGKNNKISIEWNTYEECPTLRFTIKETPLPEDVYDITIDPGHGGTDVGAIGKYNNVEYKEANLNLNVSLKLKEKLENLGYKVAMTRTDDSYVEIYEKGGSATLGNETSSKFNFAIHHNSFAYQVDYLKGLEIYVANDSDFTFANTLIDHITKEANTTISPKETYQSAPGIYQRYFTEEEIAQDDVQPSNKTTNMIWYYNIRELGGISTGATNDGRYANKGYVKNPYYNSNQTTEPYLLELGYINNPDNLKTIVNNESAYANAIANALQEYLEKNN